jgi:hypothetical protein
MLVLTTPTSGSNSVADLQKTQEQLKARLIALDPRFYTVASKDPYATYRVLWFRLPTYTTGYSYAYRDRSCKVDLLLPGIMNIPFVPKERIYKVRDEGKNYLSSKSLAYSSSSSYGSRSQSSSNSDPLPLMPFLPLLLLKLQAWQDHGESSKLYMRQKQPTDVLDITELLALAVKKYCSESPTSSTSSTRQTRMATTATTGQASKSNLTLLEKEKSWIPESFITAGKTRVKKFVRMYPSTKSQWIKIGFDIDGDAKRGYGVVKSSTDGKVPVALRDPTTGRKTGYGTRLTGIDDEIVKLQGLLKSLNVEDLDYYL